ncbi:hypothetical protein ALP42_200154 [Pseudomonas savastanoi pv. nerii]|uniref:Uncharacterized protein n=1 Tax=Pseudomonas savastanoi pv. nerii TaxID=360921 RepID=A0AB74BIM7_PSESS|nr:hypothetical protein ALP42_200154 [Pseudomonas savastanoi pv. nerii]
MANSKIAISSLIIEKLDIERRCGRIAFTGQTIERVVGILGHNPTCISAANEIVGLVVGISAGTAVRAFAADAVA